MLTTDILIIGAGPAGSALAYFLAAQGREVTLVDKSAFPRDKTCGDALSPRALHVLHTMGVLDTVTRLGFRINRAQLFAPNGRFIETPIPAADHWPDCAYILPRYQLDDVLRARAVSAGAQFHAPLAVTELIQVDGRFVGARAKSPTGPVEVRARVVVLATGASIGLLERAGLLAAPPAFGRAARAYYAGLPSLSDAIEFHFDSVPLPGYGWIFPTGPDTANVGAGYMGRANQPPLRNSPRQVFDEFIANPYIARLVAGARRTSPIKGYPLRFDFATARLAFPGLVLVGEAAGLVNPLSGEGIDYALESAEVAAAHIDRAPEDFIRAMRARFQAMFVNITRVRDVYLRPTVLNRFVTAAQRHDELAHLLMHIALGHLDPLRALAPTVLWRVALG